MADTLQTRVRSIFLAAVEDHAPDQWDEYLGDACRGEPELRRRVEVLLRGHQQPNEMLDNESAAPVPSAPPAIGEGPGTLIGAYKLLEQIGEGGFGVVFMAEQQRPVRRKVALKIVKPGMDTRQVVARFEAERQALALMDHPNIAQVFDGGATESGRPYFVMELVRGVPITEFCDQNHLAVRERLELFADVCLAVQHAHQKGIIHRDLKPNNVMVTQHDLTPVVKIIDFGIAKATGQQLTDKTLFTNFAQFIGTPMYMSPEQAQMSGLDVDTRSDVYSLGVLLYELMTGSPPFDKERMRTVAYDELIRIIREEEPVRPSTRISTLGGAAKTATIDRNSTPKQLSQLFRGELDWIVMKALEKDRNRRYESASALANDVQRFLDGEVVQACPPTVGYRLKKLARRHKAALATAAIVFVALAVGTSVAVWQAVVATQAKQQAVIAAVEEKKAKVAAEEREAESKAVLKFVVDKVIAAARPEGLGGGLGHDVSLRHAIESAVPFVQEGFKDQPLIEARLRMTLGGSFYHLGESKKAEEQYVAARELYIKHLGADDQSTLQAQMGLVWSYHTSGRFEDAIRLGESTLAKMRATLGPAHEDTLTMMAHLATGYSGLGQHKDALKISQEALEIRRRLFGPTHTDTLRGLSHVATIYNEMGRNDEAVTANEEVVTGMTAALGRDHLETLSNMVNLANFYRDLGRPLESRKLLEEVLPMQRAKLGPDHPRTFTTMFNLGRTYQSMGRHDDALKLLEDTLARRTAKLGRDHPKTLLTMHFLAISYSTVGRKADALALREEKLRLVKAKHGPDYSDTFDEMDSLAYWYTTLGRFEDGITLRQETLARRKAIMGVENDDTLHCMNNLGWAYSAGGRQAEALVMYEQTLAMRNAKLGPSHPDTLDNMGAVAATLIALKRGSEAVPIIDDCIQRASNASGKSGLINEMMGYRLQHYFKAEDVAGYRTTVEMWEGLGRTDAASLYRSARVRASLARLIRERDKSAEAELTSNTEADLAMDWLRKAVAAGYKNTAHMAKNTDLDILRKRPDFIQLMAELANLPKKDVK